VREGIRWRRLDHGAMHVPVSALSRRQTALYQLYFQLPAGWRQRLMFEARPWSLPLQRLLRRAAGPGPRAVPRAFGPALVKPAHAAHRVEVAFAAGPLRGLHMRVETAEKYFLLGRHYENDNLELLQRYALPGATVYEVGAHAGYWALALAAMVGPRGRVVALEPSPENYARLIENVALNRNASHAAPITALNLAAGAEPGRMPMSRAGTMSRLQAGAGPGGDTVQVEVARLDDLVYRAGQAAPTFVLMDVEGWGGAVMAGAERLLAERRPTWLCEVHGPEEQRHLDAALARHGYRRHSVSPASLWPRHMLAVPAC